MLGSITPLGERGRRSRWGVTVTAYTVGSAAAGVAIGGVLGWAGEGLRNVGLSDVGAVWILAAAAALGAILDLGPGGWRLPSIRRQVNEEWLQRYRGWVYGIAFGFQLGLGVVTVVSLSAVYLVLAAALLSGSAIAGAAIGGAFGLLRAAPFLAVRGIDSPGRLMRLDARIRRWDRPSRRLAVVAELGVAAAIVAAGLT